MSDDRPHGYKPFDEDLYQNNKDAEEIVLKMIKLPPGLILINNPDPYGIDLLVKHVATEIIIGGIETEKRHIKNWNGGFPFKEVNFLVRKKKYAALNNFYIQINANNLTEALMIGFDELMYYRIEISDNVMVLHEGKYKVPINHCMWGWEEINKVISLYFNNPEPYLHMLVDIEESEK